MVRRSFQPIAYIPSKKFVRVPLVLAQSKWCNSLIRRIKTSKVFKNLVQLLSSRLRLRWKVSFKSLKPDWKAYVNVASARNRRSWRLKSRREEISIRGTPVVDSIDSASAEGRTRTTCPMDTFSRYLFYLSYPRYPRPFLSRGHSCSLSRHWHLQSFQVCAHEIKFLNGFPQFTFPRFASTATRLPREYFYARHGGIYRRLDSKTDEVHTFRFLVNANLNWILKFNVLR